MTARPSSWLNEIGQKPARRPSMCGPLIPFDIPRDATRRNQRSLSESMGQSQTRLPFMLHNDFERLAVINDSTTDYDGELAGFEDYSLQATQSAGDPRQHTSMFPQGVPAALWASRSSETAPSMFRTVYDSDKQSVGSFSDSGAFRRSENSRPSTADEYYGSYKSGWYSNGPLTQKLSFHEARENALLGTKLDIGYSQNPLNYISPALRSPLSAPEAHYCVVEFKCFRAEVYQIYPNQLDEIERTIRQWRDLVIVEADRGSDLGVARLIAPSLLAARAMKRELDQKQIRHLLGFSRAATSHALSDPVSFNMDVGDYAASPVMAQARPGKYVKRVANDAEVSRLTEKKEAEEHAKDLCQKKVEEHGLVMEILDAEYQSDYNKLTFYYYAPNVIHFSPLVADLFKIYKTRIWMSPVNQQAVPKSPIAAPHSPPNSYSHVAIKRPQGQIKPRSQSQWSALSPTSPSFMSPGSLGWGGLGSMGFNSHYNGSQLQEASR